MCVLSDFSHICLSATPRTIYSPPGSCPRDSPGKNTGVGCHVLLQGIFPTQVLNPDSLCLLRWQVGSLPPVPLGKPRKQGEMAFPSPPMKIVLIIVRNQVGSVRLFSQKGDICQKRLPVSILNVVMVGAAAHSVLFPCCYLWCTVSSVFFT